MKLAKKIFVGIIAVAMLASCFMLTTSAEAPVRPIENFADLLEYGRYDTYLIEEYENYEEGDFEFVAKSSEHVNNPIFDFIVNGNASASVVADGDNNMLKLATSGKSFVGYKFIAKNNASMLDRAVFSFDFQNGTVDGEKGADFVLLATLCDYFEDVPLFGADMTDAENPKFTYAKFDEKRAVYAKVVADYVPVIGELYHVDLIYDLASGSYSISVSLDGVSVLSYSNKILGTKGLDSLRLYSKCDVVGEYESEVLIDNLYVYEGTALRNVTDPDNALADTLIALDEYAKSPDVSPEEKLEIAEAYGMLYKGENGGMSYTPVEGIENYDKMVEVVEGVDAFINCAYANAFIVYAERATLIEGYYEKISYREEYVDSYYNYYNGNDQLAQIEGLDSVYADGATYLEKIEAAIASYDADTASLATTRKYSINFVEQLEKTYSASSKNYNDMLNKYNSLSLLVGKIDLNYRYSDDVPETKYPTVADAYAVFEALGVKIEQITQSAIAFKDAVYAMDTTQVDELTPGSPFLTVDFATLYENYLIANSLLKYGTVHSSLDPKTFTYNDYANPNNSFKLSDVIEEFYVKKAYVEERIAVCNTFVSIMNGANASSYYITVKSEIERAALYIDTNKEYSLENLPEVVEAIALYDGIVARVEKNYNDAQVYIEAVSEINLEASYATLRAAIDEALILQELGNITGIDGVEDANVKLEKALAIVEKLEGNSATLVSSVAKLDGAKSLTERRNYIEIALNALAGADETIEGVTEAAEILAAAVEAYNAEVAMINAYFFGIVDNASSLIAGTVNSDAVTDAASVIGALN